ncbi:MAG: CoA transferase, partial [Ignavibacteriae bacterium]|nr:CoA transferase [Ignavibacteriota bacterium]
LLIGGKHPVLMGNDNFTAAPSGTFVTKDGYINIAANKQEQWEDLCDVLEVSELKTDERFQKRDIRKKNRKELTPILEEKLKEKETSYWCDELNAKGIPSGEILSLEAALNQPQVEHRKALQEIDTPNVGKIKVFNLTAKFDKTEGDVDAPPPLLSEHTLSILQEIGYTKEDFEKFKTDKIV